MNINATLEIIEKPKGQTTLMLHTNLGFQPIEGMGWSFEGEPPTKAKVSKVDWMGNPDVPNEGCLGGFLLVQIKYQGKISPDLRKNLVQQLGWDEERV